MQAVCAAKADHFFNPTLQRFTKKSGYGRLILQS